MSSVAKRPSGTWRARYYGSDGRQRSRDFRRKGDAERWVAEQTTKVNRGDWTDPALAKITVAEWSPTWLASKAGLKPTARRSYESLYRTVVDPRWGDVPLTKVTHAEAVAWVAELMARGLSPSRVSQALLVLRQLLALAVRDGRLGRNVAIGVKAPRQHRNEPRFLTHEQVAKLAAECGTHGRQYETLILTMAYCGPRWGELRALKVRRVDLMRRRMDIAESIPDGEAEPELPKNRRRRVVPIPRFLVPALLQAMADKGPEDLVFTSPKGHLLINSNFRRNVFDPAVRSLGLAPLTIHDLRHTTASLAISAGANIKALQRLMGHATASQTLDIYGALLDSDLDGVADRLDAAVAALQPTTGAEVRSLR